MLLPTAEAEMPNSLPAATKLPVSATRTKTLKALTLSMTGLLHLGVPTDYREQRPDVAIVDRKPFL